MFILVNLFLGFIAEENQSFCFVLFCKQGCLS